MAHKLSFETHLGRKSTELQKVILAVRSAVERMPPSYERDEEIAPWLENMVRYPARTIGSGYVHETLRKMAARMRHNAGIPAVARAIEAIRELTA